MHACSKIADRIEQNEKFKERMSGILEAIRNPQGEKAAEELGLEESDFGDEVVQKNTIDVDITESAPLEPQTVYDIPKRNLELSAREIDILEKYRGGMTLEEIGKAAGVTRERVRQIAFKAMLKQVGARVQEGFEMDADEFIKGEKMAHNNARYAIPEDERQARLRDYIPLAAGYVSIANFAKDAGVPLATITRSFPEIVEIIERKNKEKKDRWSWYYPRCRGCGTTKIPHIRKGYCEKCIGVYRGDRRESILSAKSMCAVCSLDRDSAIKKYGRDLFITRDERVLCRGCFLQLTGSKLADSRSNRG
jgi:hypothetical protein